MNSSTHLRSPRIQSEKLYYKITNENENHHDFQYRDGLNVLTEPFNNSKKSCGRGGFYFSNIKNILKFFSQEY